MAAVQPLEMSMDSEFQESLLGKIAHNVYPQYLERFAITQVGIEEAEYFHTIDGAGDDSWKKCFYLSYFKPCIFL